MFGQSHCTRTCRNYSHSFGLGNGLYSVSCTMMFEHDVTQRIFAACIVNYNFSFYIRHKILPVCYGNTCRAVGKCGNGA